MTARLIPLLAAALAACSSPNPRFLGERAVAVEIEGARFDVYADGAAAQAIRLNSEWGFGAAKMERLGLAAIERATGCRADRRTLRADPSVLSAAIVCPEPAAG